MTVKSTPKEYPPVVKKPTDPENGRLSKAEYQAKQKIEKEKQAKLREYAQKLEEEGNEEAEETSEEKAQAKPIKPAGRGRPKKIE